MTTKTPPAGWKRRLALALAGIAAATTATVFGGAPAAQAGAIRTGVFAGTTRVGSQVNAGSTMWGGQYILSPDGRSALSMQTDGNLVFYGPSPCGFLQPNICRGPYDYWASNSSGQPGNRLVMQTDGNLVVYRPNGSVAWAAGTNGSNSNQVRVTNQGYLQLVRGDGTIAKTLVSLSLQNTNNWYRGFWPADNKLTTLRYMSSYNEVYHLMQQQDGNLVLYGPANGVLWASGTVENVVGGMSGRETRMQTDGNLVVYSGTGNATALWASHSVGAGPSPEAALLDNGNLVVRSAANGTWFWQTGTSSASSGSLAVFGVEALGYGVVLGELGVAGGAGADDAGEKGL